MAVLEADQQGMTRRQIAELLWGEKRVAEEWYDGWMHGRVKRLQGGLMSPSSIFPQDIQVRDSAPLSDINTPGNEWPGSRVAG